MNKCETAIESLKNGIKVYVDNEIENIKADKTYIAVIVGIYSTDDNTYNINLNGTEYTNIPTSGGVCTVNETVQVRFPCGNSNNMYIDKAEGIYLSDITYNSTTKVLTKIYSNGTTNTITLS